ncbi:MAG: hypothetical protein CL912_33870 [Deltaproteobacteria bacterium]|nr:hypothetical protein [Deltaproteobacteria bacterium]
MRLSILSSLAMVTTGVIAATTIPLLDKIDLWGFVNLDIDGVLRSWFVKIYLISIIHQPMFQSS